MHPGAKINDFRRDHPEKYLVMAGSSKVWQVVLGFDKDGLLFLWVDCSEMILACAVLGLGISGCQSASHWAGLSEVRRV